MSEFFRDSLDDNQRCHLRFFNYFFSTPIWGCFRRTFSTFLRTIWANFWSIFKDHQNNNSGKKLRLSLRTFKVLSRRFFKSYLWGLFSRTNKAVIITIKNYQRYHHRFKKKIIFNKYLNSRAFVFLDFFLLEKNKDYLSKVLKKIFQIRSEP